MNNKINTVGKSFDIWVKQNKCQEHFFDKWKRCTISSLSDSYCCLKDYKLRI